MSVFTLHPLRPEHGDFEDAKHFMLEQHFRTANVDYKQLSSTENDFVP